MSILALDQATAITGYALFDDDQNLIRTGSINLVKNHVASIRMRQMIEMLYCLFRGIRPDIIVFEDVQQQSNVATFKVLSQLSGAIIGYCCELDIPYIIMASSHWRKWLGFEQSGRIGRKRLKEQAVEFAKEQTGKTFEEDVADAVCIGYAYFRQAEYGEYKEERQGKYEQ